MLSMRSLLLSAALLSFVPVGPEGFSAAMGQTAPAQAAPAKPAPPKTQAPKTQPAKPQAAKPEPAKATPAKASPAKAPAAAAAVAAGLPSAGAFYRDLFDRIDSGKLSALPAAPAGQRDALLDKVIQWYLLTRNFGAPSFAEIEGFRTAHQDWPAQAALRRRAEDALLADRTQSDAAVLDWFVKNPPVSRDGRIRQAAALLAVGLAEQAEPLVRRIWVEDGFSAEEEAEFIATYGPFLSPADHEAKLDRLIWRDQLDMARRQLPRVDRPIRAVAELRLDIRSGKAQLDGLLARAPAHARRDPGLLFDLARALRRAGKDVEAREIIKAAPPELIRPDLWWAEREVHIRRAIAEGDSSTAYALARDHRIGAPSVGGASGAELADAEFLAGFIALRLLSDPQAALPHFRALHEAVRTPISLARGAYWAGRAAEALGRKADAATWYERAAQHPATFYGQLAAGELRRDLSALMPQEANVSAGDQRKFEAREVARVARRLKEIGLPDRADAFILRLGDSAGNAETASMAARFAAGLGRDDLAVTIARRAFRDGVVLSESGYPLLRHPLGGSPEPALVHALIRQESGYLTTAVSKAGARGLMQLMPATAEQTARKIGLPYNAARLTADPGYNVQLGQAYLAQVIDGVGGEYAFALAAYNAGPGRVRQWLRDLGDPRGDREATLDWIERIPFQETRNYVQRVLEGMHVYRVRLSRAPTSASLYPSVDQMVDRSSLAAWCLSECRDGNDPVTP